jgi:MoaA/NifB/PqqE/SkfB family radical SAM enzyme
MSTTTAVHTLRDARARGVTALWLGGGEPTLRPDLLGLVRMAKTLGFVDVLLQTNGMRLAYADYRDAVLAAGVTEVRFNVKSHREQVHDRLSGAASHALLLSALAGLASGSARPRVSADVLLTRSSLPDLPDLVPFYAERGVTRFVLWLLSAADSTESEVLHDVPTYREIVPRLTEAAKRAAALGVKMESLHTPPCVLPPDLRHLFAPASLLGLTVVGPDGRGFALETSPFEGGAFLEGCASCRERAACGGPRADYLRLHGASEFVPLPFALHSSP